VRESSSIPAKPASVLPLLSSMPMIIASSTGLSTLSLYRKSDEDTGFYQVTWFEEKALLLGIYEGGIFSLNDSGKVLWHIEKAWNDVFVSVDKEELRFMGYDEACFSVNKVTGQRRLLES
jgi:hypothetical protein